MSVVPPESIRAEIAERIGLAHLSPADRDELINRLAENVLTKLNVLILEQLTEGERQELLAHCDRGDEHAVKNYVHEKVGDVPALMMRAVTETVTEFKVLLHSYA